jgi:hypothetical protein
VVVSCHYTLVGLCSTNSTDLATSFFDLFTLFLLTQTKAQNIPLYLLFRFQMTFLSKTPISPIRSPSKYTPTPSNPPPHSAQHRLIQPSAPRPHPNPKHPHKPPPKPNLLLRARPQQQHIQHRPLQRLQRRQRLQYPRRRAPRIPLQLGRSRVLVACRCAAPQQQQMGLSKGECQEGGANRKAEEELGTAGARLLAQASEVGRTACAGSEE